MRPFSRNIMLLGIFFSLLPAAALADLTITSENALKINKGGMIVHKSDDIRDGLKLASKKRKNIRGVLKKIDEWYVVEVKRSETWHHQGRIKRVFYDVYNLIPSLLNFPIPNLSKYRDQDIILEGTTSFVVNHRKDEGKNADNYHINADRSIYNFVVTKIWPAH